LADSAQTGIERSVEPPVERWDEPSRLASLRRYDILDTAPERSFDDIALLAAHICKAPIALVSFVDEERQWFKARVGLSLEETPRDISFCTHTICQPDGLLIVPDAQHDARFAESPMVAGEPHVRFYAGTRLMAPDGQALGTLCVKDVVPREIAAPEREALEALGRQVVTLLELRRSIRERRLLHDRYQLVLESVANAILMVDERDRIVLANAQAQAVFGHARDELIGRSIDLLVPPAQRALRARQRQARRIGLAPEAPQAETLGLRSDGTVIAIESGLAALVADDRVYVIESVLDVSHRKHIEARLSEMQTLQQAIVDNAGFGIITTSPDGLITSFNPAAQRMFGYASDEVVGLKRPDFIHDTFELSPGETTTMPAALIAADRAPDRTPESEREGQGGADMPLAPGFDVPVPTDRSGDARDCEWICVRKDGSRFPVLLSVTALREGDGTNTGYLGLAIDISERKRIENLLRAKNQDLRTFAYTVSHDLKAPLRGIVGYAQELMRRHQDGLGERARYCLAQIIAASSNLDQLVEDLLSYSRLVVEKPHAAKVSVAAVVERILSDRSLAIAENGVEVDVKLPELPLQTWERGLHQALANLIDNALKYSRESRPPRLIIRAEATELGCLIRVSDNGIGFDMKYHDRIFGLFNRLVRASEYEGTGAGLAIVAKVVDKLGGEVRAQSAPGEGATFFLHVPHLAAEPAAT